MWRISLWLVVKYGNTEQSEVMITDLLEELAAFPLDSRNTPLHEEVASRLEKSPCGIERRDRGGT